MEKSFTAQLGVWRARATGALPAPRWNCSAVTCAWCMHLGHVCGSRLHSGPHSGPHSGRRNWASDGQVGLPLQVKPLVPSTSSAQTFPGCPSQHQHPGIPMADLALILNTPFFSLGPSHAASPAPKAGDAESLLALNPPQYPHPWPRPRVCPLHLSLDSSNRRPLHGLCPPHGTFPMPLATCSLHLARPR